MTNFDNAKKFIEEFMDEADFEFDDYHVSNPYFLEDWEEDPFDDYEYENIDYALDELES